MLTPSAEAKPRPKREARRASRIRVKRGLMRPTFPNMKQTQPTAEQLAALAAIIKTAKQARALHRYHGQPALADYEDKTIKKAARLYKKLKAASAGSLE